MSVPTWKCVTCGETFGIGKWVCLDGQTNHIVENKEYLLADAPSDPGHPERGGMDSMRDGRTRVCNIPPDKTVLRNGEAAIVPGGYVEFVRGRFSTTDPEIQYYLDKKGGYCTESQWEAVWLSQGQQLKLKEMALNAREQRLEMERNELLTQVKERTKGKAVVNA
jgi:hypothetical protein